MTRDPSSCLSRLGTASSAAGVGRSPPGLPAWVGAIALLGALSLSACDDGSSGASDRGPSDAAADASSPDAMSPDAMSPDAMTPDAMSPDASDQDATSPDAALPDAAPPQAVPPTVTAGGATVESGRYRLRLSVGGASPTHVTSSDRFQARIGVALPQPDTEERPR